MPDVLTRPSKIAQWGNSAAIRLGAATLERAHLHINDPVDIIATEDEIVIRRQKPRVTMAELLARFDPARHRHDLAFGGEPVGYRDALMAYAPERGDIVLIEFSPQAGTEMAGDHRAIVLSEQAFSVATGWVVVCPITTKLKGSPFEVRIPSGLKAHGCVVASELRTMDYLARRTRFMEKAPRPLLEQVQAIACATIGCG